MSDILDRLKGNGEPWTFAEIIAEIERQRALNNELCGMAKTALKDLGKAIDETEQLRTTITSSCGCVFCDIGAPHPDDIDCTKKRALHDRG